MEDEIGSKLIFGLFAESLGLQIGRFEDWQIGKLQIDKLKDYYSFSQASCYLQSFLNFSLSDPKGKYCMKFSTQRGKGPQRSQRVGVVGKR